MYSPFVTVPNKPPRPTQPPTPSSTENEYRPKCAVTLQLGSKDRYGSFHLWINVWEAGKTVWSLVNTCHTWVLWRRVSNGKLLYISIVTSLYSIVLLSDTALLLPVHWQVSTLYTAHTWITTGVHRCVKTARYKTAQQQCVHRLCIIASFGEQDHESHKCKTTNTMNDHLT